MSFFLWFVYKHHIYTKKIVIPEFNLLVLMIRKLEKINCKICGFETKTNGIAGHIKYTHNITVDEYVSKYGEYRKKNIHYNKNESENHVCKICNKKCMSERHLSFHVKTHNITKEEYILKYIMNGKKPLCECGCGTELKIFKHLPYYNDYINGHNKSTLGFKFSEESKELMSKTRMDNLNSVKCDTGPELLFVEFLNSINVKYLKQVSTEYGCIDFYLPHYNIYVEIDGIYWHPTTSTNLNFQLMSSRISDFKKSKMVNLIRIRETDINKLKSITDLHTYNYTYDFSLKYDDIIMSASFFKLYRENKGADKLNYYLWVVRKFIRTFSPEFPYPTTTENVTEIMNYITSTNLSRQCVDNVFNGMCHHIGNSFLKSHFKSYWKSSYKQMNKTPIDAFYDDEILLKLLKFGTGYNDPNRVYNLSLKKIISWICQHKYNISFFKPLLAATIYKKFLGDIDSPTVIDTCAGFGGRLMGFKAIYPNGTYIGIEPNIETYNELLELIKICGFTNVKLYNCKLEDYKGSKNCDLTFTSIPYFDTEIYSNPIFYTDSDIWEREFIGNLLTFNNLLINIPLKLKPLFENHISEEYYIQNKKSHFNKSNTTTKFELLLKLNNSNLKNIN